MGSNLVMCLHQSHHVPYELGSGEQYWGRDGIREERDRDVIELARNRKY